MGEALTDRWRGFAIRAKSGTSNSTDYKSALAVLDLHVSIIS